MAKSRIVKITRDGGLLSVNTLTPRICRLLQAALTYTRVTQIRGEEARLAGSNIRLDPTACFRYVKDPEHDIPVQMVVLAGFLQKIVKVLRDNGYDPRLKTVRGCDNVAAYTPDWGRLSDVEWRWMQRTILNRILRNDYGQIRCPPGYGKSFMIYCLAKLLPKAKFAISTHSVDVLEQIYFELSARMPQVGFVSGRMKRTGYRVTCYSGKSLHHCEEDMDILLVDEVHEFATDHYLRMVTESRRLRFAKKFGLSASVGDRPDNADFELEGVFGPMLCDLSYQKCVEHNCVVPIEIHWRDVIMDYDPCEGCNSPVSRERAGLWQNQARNKLIAKDARSFGPDEQVLIAVETIEHAMFLKSELPEFSLCYAAESLTDKDREWYISLGCIDRKHPEMTSKRRSLMKQKFQEGKLKKVIATSVWKRGVDFKRLQVLIRADGRRSPISDMQIPGRTSRICDATGKQTSVVIDYRDQFNKAFRGRADDRRANYKKIGWRQIEPHDDPLLTGQLMLF